MELEVFPIDSATVTPIAPLTINSSAYKSTTDNVNGIKSLNTCEIFGGTSSGMRMVTLFFHTDF